MKYIDEYRNSKKVLAIAKKICNDMPREDINIMEVCGTHTQSFRKFGLAQLLSGNLHFISGPGCPVCVSSRGYIDAAVELAAGKDHIILTFGDMLRVPGSRYSLEDQKAKGRSVGIVYSPLDSLEVARKNKKRKVIFLAAGFETTAPAIALTIKAAKKEKLDNLFFLCALKLIPAAMRHLLEDKRLRLSGFLCPGHVSAIIGSRPYEFIAREYSIGCCVAGFEPLDILEGIYLLVRQVIEERPRVDNQYMRVVSYKGNIRAQAILKEFFDIEETEWRGLGVIDNSGLKIRQPYQAFDARKAFSLRIKQDKDERNTGCRCADVLKGLIEPAQCLLFGRRCTVDNPRGPCMVSSEGACNAYYRYK